MFKVCKEDKCQYILGIDPSISHTGLALLTIKPNKTVEVQTDTLDTLAVLKTSQDDYRRAWCIYSKIEELMDSLPKDTLVSIEMPPGSAVNARTSKMAGMCVGLLSPFYHRITHFYNAMAIKRFVGDKGIKGSDRKLLNIQKCNELYPNNDLRKNRLGNVLVQENNAADALLLAHMAYIDFPLVASSIKAKRKSL